MFNSACPPPSPPNMGNYELARHWRNIVNCGSCWTHQNHSAMSEVKNAVYSGNKNRQLNSLLYKKYWGFLIGCRCLGLLYFIQNSIINSTPSALVFWFKTQIGAKRFCWSSALSSLFVVRKRETNWGPTDGKVSCSPDGTPQPSGWKMKQGCHVRHQKQPNRDGVELCMGSSTLPGAACWNY